MPIVNGGVYTGNDHDDEFTKGPRRVLWVDPNPWIVFGVLDSSSMEMSLPSKSSLSFRAVMKKKVLNVFDKDTGTTFLYVPLKVLPHPAGAHAPYYFRRSLAFLFSLEGDFPRKV